MNNQNIGLPSSRTEGQTDICSLQFVLQRMQHCVICLRRQRTRFVADHRGQIPPQHVGKLALRQVNLLAQGDDVLGRKVVVPPAVYGKRLLNSSVIQLLVEYRFPSFYINSSACRYRYFFTANGVRLFNSLSGMTFVDIDCASLLILACVCTIHMLCALQQQSLLQECRFPKYS